MAEDLRRALAARQQGKVPPYPYSALARSGVLRQRFADVLTDTLRAQLLRLLGYRVEVVEFVDSRHTPRNVLLRAERAGARPDSVCCSEYQELVTSWGVQPALARLLPEEVAAVLGPGTFPGAAAASPVAGVPVSGGSGTGQGTGRGPGPGGLRL